MPRMVPSRVVSTIEQMFPWVIQPENPGEYIPWEKSLLQANVEIVEQIPDILLALDEAGYADFIKSLAVVRSAAQAIGPGRQLAPVEKKAIRDLRQLLGRCPDDQPDPNTAGLEFIDADEELRSDLRRDMSEISRALQNAEWKASTVFSGTTIEALLLWALRNKANKQQVDGVQGRNPKPLEEWYLRADPRRMDSR